MTPNIRETLPKAWISLPTLEREFLVNADDRIVFERYRDMGRTHVIVGNHRLFYMEISGKFYARDYTDTAASPFSEEMVVLHYFLCGLPACRRSGEDFKQFELVSQTGYSYEWRKFATPLNP